MNDTTDTPTPLPEQPQQPVVEAQVVPIVEAKSVGRPKGIITGILANLSDAAKVDMESVMLQKPISALKVYMVEKYGEAYPALKTLSVQSYANYKKKHKERIQKQVALQVQISAPPEEMQTVINAITSTEVSLEDKRKALNSLFNVCNARRQLLETRNQGFIDPMIEGLILANVKEMRVIIEKLAVLNDQLTKEAQTDYLQEFETFYEVIIAAVSNTYRIVNGDMNYQQFLTALDMQIQSTLKAYRVEKNNLRNPRS